MNRYFTKTFSKFLGAFLAILALSFGIMLLAAKYVDDTPAPVDNVALPR